MCTLLCQFFFPPHRSILSPGEELRSVERVHVSDSVAIRAGVSDVRLSRRMDPDEEVVGLDDVSQVGVVVLPRAALPLEREVGVERSKLVPFTFSVRQA